MGITMVYDGNSCLITGSAVSLRMLNNGMKKIAKDVESWDYTPSIDHQFGRDVILASYSPNHYH